MRDQVMYQNPKAKVIEESSRSPTIDQKELQITLKLQHPFLSANRVKEDPVTPFKVEAKDVSVFSTNDETTKSFKNTAISESPSIRKTGILTAVSETD